MKETLEFLNTLVTSAFCKQSMSSRKQNFFLFQEPDVSRRLCGAPHQKETQRDGDEQKSTAEWELCHQATWKQRRRSGARKEFIKVLF